MKVAKLFIIALMNQDAEGDWWKNTEIYRGANALYRRYNASLGPENVSVIIVKTFLKSEEETKRWGGDVPVTFRLQGGASPADGNTNTGVYILGHKWDDRVTNLRPKDMARLLTAIGFVSIRKICLLSCSATGGTIPVGEYKDLTDDYNYGYLEKFCHALFMVGYRAKVAGWRGFISVVYQGQGADAIGPVHKTKNRYIDHELLDGHKYVKYPPNVPGYGGLSGKKALVVPAVRDLLKVAYKITDQGVLRISLDEWHDSV